MSVRQPDMQWKKRRLHPEADRNKANRRPDNDRILFFNSGQRGSNVGHIQVAGNLVDKTNGK